MRMITWVLAMIRRAARTTSRLADLHRWSRTRTGVQADVPGPICFPRKPPRESGTGRAFGLALAMHAVLAALLFPGMRWTSGSPASVQVAGVVRLAPPLTSAAPRTASHPAAAMTGQSALLAAGNPRPTALHHIDNPKIVRARPKAKSAVPSLLAQRPPIAGARKLAKQADGTADRQREARLAVLRTAAGASLPDNDPQRGNDGIAVSAGYADRVARRVRPYVVAPFDIHGNPSAVIAVTCAPNGALLSATLQRSSGNPQWDRAVLSAVERSDPMPRDANGTAPASFLITFQPRG